MMASVCRAHSSARARLAEYASFLTRRTGVNCVAGRAHKVKPASDFPPRFVACDCRRPQDRAMKILQRLTWIFLVIGLAMLVGALFFWNSTRSFVAHAQTTQGKVVELIEVRDKDGGSSTWKPRVTYRAPTGQQITFESSFSTNPAPYSVGETVDVLYLPSDPAEARIRGYQSLWLGPTILGGLGLVFTAIGGGMLLARNVARKKRDYLMAYGNALETDLQGVERNTSLEVNGQHPWRITSQWLDPVSNKLRVFHSENLWFDPEKFVSGKRITVLLDPKDPKRYYMDVSFLPQLEDAR
jgi:Protein of unknown function (DUF3592)